jgi:hypothetical protein
MEDVEPPLDVARLVDPVLVSLENSTSTSSRSSSGRSRAADRVRWNASRKARTRDVSTSDGWPPSTERAKRQWRRVWAGDASRGSIGEKTRASESS